MTGLGVVVLHHVAADDAVPSLVSRIRGLQANGQRALVITVLHPVTSLRAILSREDGIDEAGLGFIDCTGERQKDEPGDDILFVESPSMVETILVRTDRLLKRMGPDTAVVVHTLDTFTVYSPPRLVAEFAHCLVNNLRVKGVDIEFLSIRGNAGDQVIDHIQALVDAPRDAV